MQRNRPVVMLGAGARGVDMAKVISWGMPILTSWQVKDLIDNDHPLYFGSPGIYGQRHANKILHAADYVLALGNRMSIWNAGYEGPRSDQRVVMVDLDRNEADKFCGAELVSQDCRSFVEKNYHVRTDIADWLSQCANWRIDLPLVESPTHDDRNGYINSYRFMEELQKHLLRDEVIVSDMGAPLICAHQVLRLKPPQRLMTSGGLGEMGCAFPAAVGASIARGRGRVLCLSADGSAMLNLQELQTIVHQCLPIKIIIFNNSGYGMIRHTQRAAGLIEAGIDAESGVSFPDYRRLALGFGITAADIDDWSDFHRLIPSMLDGDYPCLINYWMDPQQKYHPKLEPVWVDGKATSPSFDNMSPIL